MPVLRGRAGHLSPFQLQRQLEELLARVASAPVLSFASRELAKERTRAVAEAVGKASESPEGLRRTLRDPRVLVAGRVVRSGRRVFLASGAPELGVDARRRGTGRAAERPCQRRTDPPRHPPDKSRQSTSAARALIGA